MLVKDLIALLQEQDPEADFVLFRDLNPSGDLPFRDENGDETEIETQEIQLTIDDIVLGNTYVGIQIPND